MRQRASPTVRVSLGSALTPSDRAALEAALVGVSGTSGPVRVVDDGGLGRYRLSGPAPSPTLLAALAAWCRDRDILIAELRTTGSTLEERYLELTGRVTEDRA